MEQKDKYFFAQAFVSFLMLVLVVALFQEALLGYELLLVLGLWGGFAFSWFNRERRFPYMKAVTAAGAVAVFVMLIYLLSRSTLLYQEVILILVKVGVLLSLVLSFDSYPPSTLMEYIQALSVPLFMCFPLFVKKYDETHAFLVLGYFICWAALFKIKFFELFSPPKVRNIRRLYPVLLLSAIFVGIILISRFLFFHYSLGSMEKGGLLIEEDKYVRMREDVQQREFYELQEKLQKEIQRLLPELDPKSRQEVLYMLSSLIQEPKTFLEVEKAAQGLMDFLKRPGAGVEKGKAEELAMLIKAYRDKKIENTMQKYKDEIMNKLRSNNFNLKDQLSIMNRVNRMHTSTSYSQARNAQAEIEKMLSAPSVTPKARREIKELLRQVMELKAIELYHRTQEAFSKKTRNLEEAMKKEFLDLTGQIESLKKLAELKKAQGKLEELKERLADTEKAVAQLAKETVELKSEMMLSSEAVAVTGKLESYNLPVNEQKELEEDVGDIKDAEEPRSFSEAVLRLHDKSSEQEVNIAEEIRQLLETKMYLLTRQIKEAIKEMLKENAIPDQGKELLEEMEKLEQQSDTDRVLEKARELREQIEKYFVQGFISEAVRDKLLVEVENIKNLMLFAVKVKDMFEARERSAREAQEDYQKSLRETIEKTTLQRQQKDLFLQFAERLFAARSLVQVDNVREAVEKETERLVKEGVSREEARKLKEAFAAAAEIQKVFILERAFSALKEKLEALKEVSPKDAAEIREIIDNLKAASSEAELKKEMDTLIQALDAKLARIAKEAAPESRESKETVAALLQELEAARSASLDKLREKAVGGQQIREDEDLFRAWRQFLESLPGIREQRREALRQLADQLRRSQSIPEVEKAEMLVEKEIEAAAGEGLLRDAVARLEELLRAMAEAKRRELMEQEFRALKELLEELKAVDPQVAEQLQETIKRIEEAKTSEELEQQMDIFAAQLAAEKKEQPKDKKEQEKEGPWQIYLLPVRLVVAQRQAVPLKVIAVYNNLFARELSAAEVEWYSSNPAVAGVDKKGVVRPLANGMASIRVRFRGQESDAAEVIVVEPTQAQTEERLRRELP